jgi:succinate dehydrogenase/fumarate reductase flavoprotein subunit
VYRPGGSALNAGQVGAVRAAQHIAQHGNRSPLHWLQFEEIVRPILQKHQALYQNILSDKTNVQALTQKVQKRMSTVGGAIRSYQEIVQTLQTLHEEIENSEKMIKISSVTELPSAYRLRDIHICQYMVLSSMADYYKKGGKSRGGALYTDENGILPDGLEETFRFVLDNNERDDQIQEMTYEDGICTAQWRKVRELPKHVDFFENVWREYRIDRNVR